ncbi:hypothetical protein Vafri_7350, partial [Volvox africanus]
QACRQSDNARRQMPLSKIVFVTILEKTEDGRGAAPSHVHHPPSATCRRCGPRFPPFSQASCYSSSPLFPLSPSVTLPLIRAHPGGARSGPTGNPLHRLCIPQTHDRGSNPSQHPSAAPQPSYPRGDHLPCQSPTAPQPISPPSAHSDTLTDISHGRSTGTAHLHQPYPPA